MTERLSNTFNILNALNLGSPSSVINLSKKCFCAGFGRGFVNTDAGTDFGRGFVNINAGADFGRGFVNTDAGTGFGRGFVNINAGADFGRGFGDADADFGRAFGDADDVIFLYIFFYFCSCLKRINYLLVHIYAN
jgi:hypothetical protein